MLQSGYLKKSIFISIFGHLLVFGMFSFSLGPYVSKMDHGQISFWGQVLKTYDLKPSSFLTFNPRKIFTDKQIPLRIDRSQKVFFTQNIIFGVKPQGHINVGNSKSIYTEKTLFPEILQNKKEHVVMFYPKLPYHFLLYFKDRQFVHIEVKAKFENIGRRSIPVVKRSISSGNLEADLLSARYIEHYLFIQQNKFIGSNQWQTVKIDLSAKND